MKKLLIITISILLTTAGYSTPPLRRTFQYRQSDGTMITATKSGNSDIGFYETTDGMAIGRKDGSFYYLINVDGDAIVSDFLAHDPSSRDAAEVAFVRQNGLRGSDLIQQSIAKRSPSLKSAALNADGLGTYGKSAPGTVCSQGQVAFPVIMVGFADKQFQKTTTREKIQRLYSEEGYNDEPNAIGSVRDYFIDQSNGMFVPEFQVVDSITLSRGYAYYGANGSGTGKDANVDTAVREAIDSAISHGVNFRDFVVARSGATTGVPCVIIYYAGPGEHSSYEEGCDDYLWAQWKALGYTSSSTKIRFNSYFIGNELLQSYKLDSLKNIIPVSQEIDGIGVCCHELGHSLGLPDLYNTNNQNASVCMDYWSPMDYGHYINNGYSPIGHTAYEKGFLGWIAVEKLEGDARVCQLYPTTSGDGTVAYKVPNKNSSSNTTYPEYYLLENRQPGKWYPDAMGSGMLAMHVDYLAASWSANTLNNTTSHLRMTYLPADGTKQAWRSSHRFSDFAGDLYGNEVTEITEWPVYTGTMDAPIYNIKNEGGIVSFCYLDETVGISDVKTSFGDAEIFTIDGRKVLNGRNGLTRGIYIIRENGVSKRVFVR